MTKNRNLCGILDLRNKFVTASGDHKIYHVIKLWQSMISGKSFQTNKF